MGTRPRRDESGATALLVALLAIVLFACGALAVDISSLAMERQRLHDHVDSAAHAGAYELPDNGTNAVTEAVNMARSQDPEIDPDVSLYCIVASTGAAKQVKTYQIPATCNPGPAPYTSGHYPGLRCNQKLCAIPCVAAEGDKCNAVHVSDSKAVDFGIAPVIGINEGNTGSVASTACKGSCGEESPNPLDVVFVADRTLSMLPADREDMKEAILESLKTMTPSMHHVAFGALHKSLSSTSGCKTTASTSPSATSGTWVPLTFSKSYLTSGSSPALSTSDPLVAGISCLPSSPSYGTNLAAAFKGAALRLLQGSTLPGRTGTPKKVLVFETDGMPDETITTTGYYGIDSTTDFSAGPNGNGCSGNSYYSNGWCRNYLTNNNGETGCDNLVSMAGEAKSRGITVITVGFGQAATGGCTITNRNRNSTTTNVILPQTGGSTVREHLAAAASPNPVTGDASAAGDCSSSSGRLDENTDGDYFFCAVEGAEMKDIFSVAISQVTTGIRYVKLPS